MPTYVYETVPKSGGGDRPRQFEFRQSIHDAPLKKHPETGEPVRRVIAGGVGILGSSKSATPAPMPAGGGCCGGGACGCH